LSDHEPALGHRAFPESPRWTSGFDLAAGVDVLIHDAQYADGEYDDHVGWGHSALSHTLAFATTTGVRRLVTFHHDPGHDDDTLGRLLDEARGTVAHPFAIVPGTEGLSLDLGAN
ncbi:MAG: MBL fold metallo-hydrolase, partial [Candidatus Rokuibacteriota bacterium]